MKKLNIFWFFIFISSYYLGSCSPLNNLADPSSANSAKSLSDYASIQELADQSFKSGIVPQYTTNGNKSGLITLGDAGGCVVMTVGKLKCWGQNDYAQVGLGTTIPITPTPGGVSSPTWATAVNPISGQDIIVSVVAGRSSTCAFFFSGYKCWGNQNSGVLGNSVNSTTPATSPQFTTNTGGKIVKSVQLNDGYSCILDNTGKVTCWGANTNGQLGDGTTTATLTGVAASLGSNATLLVGHNSDSCALLSNGNVKCWGKDFGTIPSLPVSITTSNAVSLLGGGTVNFPFLGCAVLIDSTVQCFGNSPNTFGEFGNGTKTAPSSTTTGITVLNSNLQPLTGAVMVGSGGANSTAYPQATIYAFSCAVTDDYTSVYCWGGNYYGNVGNGTNTDSNVAVKVTQTWPNSAIIDLAVSDGRACVLLKNNDVWCWGGNFYGFGELGNGSLTGTTNVPIKILNRNDP
ncbi:RCC1 domain-containing protein [Silvanigrella aquatica]|uniref:Uncharacterized protein n=1 Tax=Silvanigrella aquatica TaxID=1915309 RepID=A0A1L4CZB6_9BACT|nr:hypothetical protein [Silvanigrella aquatica]APJ03288.1 hypothetical protein AXG55_04975 [Silvanigrella aquatica]